MTRKEMRARLASARQFRESEQDYQRLMERAHEAEAGLKVLTDLIARYDDQARRRLHPYRGAAARPTEAGADMTANDPIIYSTTFEQPDDPECELEVNTLPAGWSS